MIKYYDTWRADFPQPHAFAKSCGWNLNGSWLVIHNYSSFSRQRRYF